ncbi:MAG: DNA gyrase inhibitor YacG, partial [Stenotrophobium sp.]
AHCPQCGEPARLDAGNIWRPFCCERCKLLDLGEWFDERKTIPGEAEDITNSQDETLQ